MCGIYGLLVKNGHINDKLQADISLLFQRFMGHRGPDGSGVFVNNKKNLLLGHLRLSIIDIENGSQPMESDDGDSIVVFNGEIYNHSDLRKDSTYNFSNQSDTETILSEYQSKGDNFCNYLNGMYGIAIYSELGEKLSIVVDPLGIKSVYLYEDDNIVLFSSELRALSKVLLKLFGASLEVDKEASISYFYHGMFVGDDTAVKNIKKLLPGQKVTYSTKDYTRKSDKVVYSSDTSSTDLASVISAAVERQSIADVPVCLFFSGGIDSSIIANALSKGHKKLKCYTFSFESESNLDESRQAIELANKLGLDIEIVSIKEDEILNAFSTTIDEMDEPICDFALIPLSKLSSVASKEYKVCLLGDGGDELFYGYTHHKYWRVKLLFSKQVFNKLNTIISNASFYLEKFNNKSLTKLSILLKLLNPHTISYGPFSSCIENYFLDSPSLDLLGSLESLKQWEMENSLSRKLLQKTDRVTMRHSLEARVPLLDLDVLSYSRNYSIRDCIQSKLGKQPLRYLLKGVDLSTSSRAKKGFRTPSKEWVKGAVGQQIFDELCQCIELKDLIVQDSIIELFNEHNSDKRDNSLRILALYSYSRFWNNIRERS